jgi:hypothetical protein
MAAQGGRPTPVKGAKRGLIALAAAIAALVVASAALVVGWRALDQAGAARDIANARIPSAPTGAPAQDATTGPPAAQLPTDPTGPATEPVDPAATGTVPTLNARTVYDKKYTNESLKMSAGCGDTVNIDLDEPRLRVATENAELTFDTPCGARTSTFTFTSGVAGSAVESADTTPAECNDKIRTSPLGEIPQPVRRGRVFCVMTSLDNARGSGDTWKMVVVEIKSTAEDGTVTIEANAWNIPN